MKPNWWRYKRLFRPEIGLMLTVFFLIGVCYGQVDAVPLDDHGDTYKEATDLFLNSSQTGQIDSAEDVDYFRLEITEAGELTVYTTGSLDTVGSMEDDAGVFANGDQGGEGNNFSIVYEASPETYYIRVSGNQNATGTYTLHASLSVPWEQVPEEEIIEEEIIEEPETEVIEDPKPEITEAPDPDRFAVEIVDPETHIIVDLENDTRARAWNLPLGTYYGSQNIRAGIAAWYRVQVSTRDAGEALFESSCPISNYDDTVCTLYKLHGSSIRSVTYDDDGGSESKFQNRQITVVGNLLSLCPRVQTPQVPNNESRQLYSMGRKDN